MAIEDVARLRDGLGAAPPVGVPQAFLEPVADPVGDLLARYARTHGPFLAGDPARRLGLGVAVVEQTLARLEAAGRVVQGEFRPGGSGREWLDAEVLRRLRRRSLAALRREVEPVPTEAMARFLQAWQGVGRPGPARPTWTPCSGWSSSSRARPCPPRPWSARSWPPASPATTRACSTSSAPPARSSGPAPGRSAPTTAGSASTWPRAPRCCSPSRSRSSCPPGRPGPRRPGRLGAMFFRQLSDAVAPPNDSELLLAVWELVWAGHVTNDTLAPLRALVTGGSRPTTRRRAPTRRYGRRGSRPAHPHRPPPPRAAGASFRPPPRPTRPGGCTRWPSSCWTGTGC